jgi:hypothetical protein
MKDDSLTLCPQCNENTLYRVITGGLLSKLNDPRTLGTLAERNFEKLGHYEKEKIIAEQQSKMGKINKMKEVNKFAQKIQNMSPARLERYIMEGK